MLADKLNIDEKSLWFSQASFGQVKHELKGGWRPAITIVTVYVIGR